LWPGRWAADAHAVQAKNAVRSWICALSVIVCGNRPYFVEFSPKNAA
jgi:hypothetical protein